MKEHFMDNTSTPPKIPIWLKLCLWTGLACIGQFFIFALIGVIRGYSIQSWTSRMSFYVMLGGQVLLSIIYAGSCFVFREELPKMTWRQIPAFFGTYALPLFLSLLCSGLVSYVGLLQGRYAKQGDKFYKQKNYPAAITLYQKEVDTWYLRLRYNYHENTSLLGIAQSYCQLENFEQGRKTYQYLSKMARGLYQELGQKKLAELDKELGNIAEFEKQLANAADDNQKADILFGMALSYRTIGCDKKTREQYALIQTLNVDESTKEQAGKFAVNER